MWWKACLSVGSAAVVVALAVLLTRPAGEDQPAPPPGDTPRSVGAGSEPAPPKPAPSRGTTPRSVGGGSTPAPAKQGKRFALLVGINKYAHARFSQLKYAERDAQEMGDLLRTYGYDVTVLPGDKADKQTIEKAIERLSDQCKENDLLLLAFAGHGVQFTGESDAYFCPHDGRPFADRKDSLVSLHAVGQTLRRSFASTKVILVDACRSDLDDTRGVRGINDRDDLNFGKGTLVLLSCSATQVAAEPDKLQHGVFFHCVLEGLRGKAANDEGEVNFNRLAEYVLKTVPLLEKGQLPQQILSSSKNPVLALVPVRPAPEVIPGPKQPPPIPPVPEGPLFKVSGILICGANLIVNHAANNAEVEGIGCMSIPNSRGLDGAKADASDSSLTVHCGRGLLFTGRKADFKGKVIAFQGNTTIWSKDLDLTLNRGVSFSEGEKGTQPVSVAKIICSDAQLREEIRDQKGKLIRWRVGTFGDLAIDSVDRHFTGNKGSVTFWGTHSQLAPDKQGYQSIVEEMRLTRVEFPDGRMNSVARDNSTVYKFTYKVEILHLPAGDPEISIDRANLPKGGFLLSCEQVNVEFQPAAGKSWRHLLLDAKNVTLRTAHFVAQADQVKFDDNRNAFLLLASADRNVTVTKLKDPKETKRGKYVIAFLGSGDLVIDPDPSFEFHKDAMTREAVEQSEYIRRQLDER
jgi:Caspase domain